MNNDKTGARITFTSDELDALYSILEYDVCEDVLRSEGWEDGDTKRVLISLWNKVCSLNNYR